LCVTIALGDCDSIFDINVDKWILSGKYYPAKVSYSIIDPQLWQCGFYGTDERGTPSEWARKRI
jgi:hypothetical protein